MAWCFSTRASVATVLTTHPCVSQCLRVKYSLSKISFMVYYSYILWVYFHQQATAFLLSTQNSQYLSWNLSTWANKMHSLVIHWLIKMHSLAIYRLIKMHSLPVYRLIKIHLLAIYGPIKMHSLVIYRLKNLYSLAIYWLKKLHSVAIYRLI